MRPLLKWFLATIALVFWSSDFISATASETQGGKLLIIGGNLRRDNVPLHRRLIADAGGREARFGILPTAAPTLHGAKRFADALEHHGVDPERIQIIDLTLTNSKEQANNPRLVEQIRKCTAIFMSGGDQTWITRALRDADGSDTPALTALRDVWQRGGLIAGSSAGAAVQSEVMISVSGLPDDALDEGMDALDFGLTRNADRRGLFVSRGLALFRAGIVDQHFGQFRGRLGRLARVVIEQRQRYGFGVDEDTAMAVGPNGEIEVVGTGNVTIVDAAKARCEDGPLGCRISGVTLSLLSDGDRFDPGTGRLETHRDKSRIAKGKESNNGNHLIPDIAGEGALWSALVDGLGDNTARKQVGITLRYRQHFGHGYRFTFTETDETQCLQGYVNGTYVDSVINARLDIEPIDAQLRSPPIVAPVDLTDVASRPAIEGVLFRGILLSDDTRQFRPNDAITRAELAGGIAQTLRLSPPRHDPPVLTDIDASSPQSAAIVNVVAAKLMSVNERGAFRPSNPVSHSEAAGILAKVAQIFDTAPPAIQTSASDGPVTRASAALALHRILGFPW